MSKIPFCTSEESCFFERRTVRDTQATRREFLCPITGNLMTDPVVAADGETYERKAIEEWFSRNQTSFTTKETLTTLMLFPNNVLKKMIADEIHAKQKEKTDFEISDTVFASLLNVASEQEKIAIVRKEIFVVRFRKILSDLENKADKEITLSYNRNNPEESNLLKPLIETLRCCAGLTVQDAGTPPLARISFLEQDNAMKQLNTASIILSMRFPRSERNRNGNNTCSEDAFVSRRLFQAVVLCLAVDGEVGNCFDASSQNCRDNHILYQTNSNIDNYAKTVISILEKCSYLSKEQATFLMCQIQNLQSTLSREITDENILLAISKKHEVTFRIGGM